MCTDDIKSEARLSREHRRPVGMGKVRASGFDSN